MPSPTEGDPQRDDSSEDRDAHLEAESKDSAPASILGTALLVGAPFILFALLVLLDRFIR